jgi:hypothetical protein
MSYRKPISGHAERYTKPCLWSFGALQFIAIFAIYTHWGAVGVMLFAYSFDLLIIRRIPQKINERA